MNITQEKDPVILCWLQICEENLLLTQGTLRKKEDASARVTNDARQDTAPGLWSCKVQILCRSSHVCSSEPEILFCL